MKKKLLKQLIEISYNKNNLQKSVIEKIAPLLTRAELKQYIRALKAKERSLNVQVITVTNLSTQEKALQTLFPDKKLSFVTDPDLLAGIRVVYNDSVYEMSMRSTLHHLQEYINE